MVNLSIQTLILLKIFQFNLELRCTLLVMAWIFLEAFYSQVSFLNMALTLPLSRYQRTKICFLWLSSFIENNFASQLLRTLSSVNYSFHKNIFYKNNGNFLNLFVYLSRYVSETCMGNYFQKATFQT